VFVLSIKEIVSGDGDAASNAGPPYVLYHKFP